MSAKKPHAAWFVLLGVVLIRGLAGGGVNMTAALFLPSVSEELGVGIGSLSLYFSVISAVMVVWLPIAGKLINRYDVRVMAAAGAALQLLSFAALGFMDALYGWYALAIPYAMGSTILLQLLGPILINRWFAKNAGLMLGLQMAVVSLFGAALQPFASHLIVQRGWRLAYRLLGCAAFLAVAALALLLLRNRPQDRGLLPYGAETTATGRPAASRPGGGVQIPQGQALRSASFVLLLLFLIFVTGVGVFTQHLPTYGAALGYSLQSTGAVLASSSVGSAVGSVVIGLVSDRIGGLKTCWWMLGIGALAILGLLLSGSGVLLFALSAFAYGLMTSGITVLAPILTLAFYGQADYERIFARVAMGAPLASILLVPAYGFVYDWTGSYRAVLLGMLLLLLLAAVCIALGWKKRCTLEGCPGWRE